MTTGMMIDGIFASEAIDSSGEVFDVEGSDISDLEEGRGIANWEHRGDDVPGASGLDIVGRIVFARKIFSASDCENDRQRSFWDKIKLPFVYGIVRLYDGAGHQSAIALAAMIRDHVANGEPILVRFSIEGSTLEKERNRLRRTVARRVALTIKPCNRTCDSGLVVDPNAPDGFKKEPEVKAKDVLDDIVDAVKHEHPLYTKLGGSTEVETSMPFVDGELVKSMVKSKIAKALTAGMPSGAPSTLEGGAALQREDRSKLINTMKAAVRDYKPEEHGDFRKFLKSRMPEAHDSFIDHFAGLVDDYRAKLKKAGDDAPFDATNDVDVDDAPATPELPKKSKKPKSITFRGEQLKPNPGIREGHYEFDENTGVLHSALGTLKLWNPDDDKSYGTTKHGRSYAGETFRQVWNSPAVRKQHDYAVRNWLKVHEALKSGRLPQAVLATAVAFSQLSPNTPVPVHEMMYGYLLDTFKRMGKDVRDPSFGHGFENLYQEAVAKHPGIPKAIAEKMPKEEYEAKMRAINEGRRKILSQHPYYGDWIGRDQPQGFPDSSREYFEREINKLISNKNASKATGRGKGERASFMLPVNKFRNMSQYHELHDALKDLVMRHGADGRGAVEELMNGKNDGNLAVPGLAPKTGRFTYAMLGAGNIFVPDTHFSRHLFGLDKQKDGATINLVRNNLLWGEQNSNLVGAFDRWYFRNHPAVALMLRHPEFGEYFRSNPEQAIFPAFWGHWLTISEHEKMLGHRAAAQASNQSASHRPVFEEVGRLSEDPQERTQTIPARATPLPVSPPPGIIRKSEDSQELIHPIRAAYMLHDWVKRYGEGPALFAFYTHVIPMLMPDSETLPQTTLEHTVRKMEATAIDLKKIASEARTPAMRPDAPKPVFFAGREVKPGHAIAGDGKPLAVLHVDEHHVFAVPHEALGQHTAAQVMKLPRRDEGRTYDIKALPDSTVANVVDGHVHGIPYCNTSPEQLALIHNMDVSKLEPTPEHTLALPKGNQGITKPVWVKNAQGKMVLIKTGAPVTGHLGYARREVAYHNVARDIFGLGHYVPTTSVFRSPVTGSEYSAQEMVPNAKHTAFETSMTPWFTTTHTPAPTSEQALTLLKLHREGELDKLRIMNAVLGNTDRHEGNMVFTDDKNGPPLRMIDHGHAFSTYGSYDWPSYWELTHETLRGPSPTGEEQNPEDENVHPDALKWVQGLNADELEQQLKHYGVDDWRVRSSAKTLRILQARAAEHPSFHRRGSFFNLDAHRDDLGMGGWQRSMFGKIV
jgi:hypothetical protein